MTYKVPSRSKRFQTSLNKISYAKSEIEELRDELNNWLDNMPENLKNSSKAEALETSIDDLDNLISSLEECENTSVEFPGMF